MWKPLLCLASLTGCSMTQAHCPQQIVELAKYSDIEECWTNANGKFVGYVILSRGNRNFLPTFVSKNCQLTLNEKPPRDEIYSVVASVNPIRVADISAPYEKGNIGSNRMANAPRMQESDDVYLLTSTFKVRPDGRETILDLTDILAFKNTGWSVVQFFKARNACPST
jgi:hypothetical protein